MKVNILDSEIKKVVTSDLVTEATKSEDPNQAARIIESKLKGAGIEAVAKVKDGDITVKRVLRD